MAVTFIVFSRPVDRPPDDNEVKIEITQAIFPELISSIKMEQSISNLTINLEPEKKSDDSPTAKIESEALEPSITERHSKIAGTENEQYGNYDNTLNRAITGNHYKIDEILPECSSKVQPRIRGSDQSNSVS
jgi:hypothetical protein